MTFIKIPHISLFILLVHCLLHLVAPPCARTEEGEDTVGLFNAWQEQSATATRVPKPLSQTAENITIISRPEIEALNAHTLADVLSTVSGIQTWNYGGAGGYTQIYIQGSNSFHALVMVDGIPLNTLGENVSDVGMVPARIIERVEIVKGAASSSWGQALGGVINVITKIPEQRKLNGVVTTSIGEGTTADTGVELSGKVDRLGYYLSGGYLGFRNIPSHISTNSNDAYVKFTYDLPGEGQVWGTFSHSHANRTNLYVPGYWDLREDQKTTYLYASLGMRRKLTENLQLEVLGRHAYRAFDTVDTDISDGLPWLGSPPLVTREKVYGVSSKLVWRVNRNLVVLGGDFEHVEISTTGTQSDSGSGISRSTDRWGVYLNDTISLGDLTIIPGIRFDRPNVTSDQVSPSLGITYPLGEKTLLRGYTGRGFSLWALAIQTVPAEKIWTSQIGIETSIVPYLWQKLTLFRNETWNIGYAHARRIALGTEYEIRTTPVYNTSIGAGYTFTDTKETSTDTQAYGAARHTVQLALRYDNQPFRGVLTGRHIYWNMGPSNDGHYGGLIWDLHLGATLLKREDRSLEIFFSGHNLFNGSQTRTELIPTPGRWFEGGMRVRF